MQLQCQSYILDQRSPTFSAPWTSNGGGSGEGEGRVSHMHPNPAHAQMELHGLACHLILPVPNGPQTSTDPWTRGWVLLF